MPVEAEVPDVWSIIQTSQAAGAGCTGEAVERAVVSEGMSSLAEGGLDEALRIAAAA